MSPRVGTGFHAARAISGALDDELKDLSDLAVADGTLYLLSEESRCVARLAHRPFYSGQDLEVDTLWKVPGDCKAEGLIFREDGACSIGFDVKLRDEPKTPNLLLATLP